MHLTDVNNMNFDRVLEVLRFSYERVLEDGFLVNRLKMVLKKNKDKEKMVWERERERDADFSHKTALLHTQHRPD